MQRKPVDKKAAAARTARTEMASKNLPATPPPEVTEPGEDQEQYITGGYLGKGGFAICYQGTLKRNRRVFAMKVVRSDMPRKMQDKVFQRKPYGMQDNVRD